MDSVDFSTYDQVPWFRRQWFFWIMYFALSPVALVILVSGDVFYVRRGVVKRFGRANRIVAGLLAALFLLRVSGVLRLH